MQKNYKDLISININKTITQEDLDFIISNPFLYINSIYFGNSLGQYNYYELLNIFWFAGSNKVLFIIFLLSFYFKYILSSITIGIQHHKIQIILISEFIAYLKFYLLKIYLNIYIPTSFFKIK